MAEKLDLFELNIKRGLENQEEPWNEADWDSLEKRLDGLSHNVSGAAGAGFLANFTLAAAALAGLAVFFVQPSSKHLDAHAQNQTQEKHASHLDALGQTSDTSLEISIEEIEATSSELLDNSSESSAEEIAAAQAVADQKIATSNLTKAEEERMIRINERLKKAAEAKAAAESNDSVKKRFTTRYVGKDFDLGAARTFSPNNDGVKEFFIPNTLRDGDIFVMSISDDSGRLIFRTKEVAKPWTGKDTAGKDMPMGHYSWEVIVQKDNKKEIFKGVVRLER